MTVTTLVKQTLFPELDSMERRFRRLFDGMPLMTGLMSPAAPAADVYETSEEFVVELEVPGFEEKELGIEVSDHVLKVSGTRVGGSEESDKDYRLRERLERTFERSFVLPAEVETDRVSATFESGVLEIHAPRLKTATPHTVEITT
jgi:HSP20 family protein